ncbi:hypothetical protein TrST_g11219 [Triparma strigata]|uniref:Fe2OG dioxygenase domain-containing protein n=1 Tax=Triparma strigata TaxID=1606541 RepID=A0A9W7EKC7_9STRA|nr:hypothetical protein TrST_g11219 [Triparma strigata]
MASFPSPVLLPKYLPINLNYPNLALITSIDPSLNSPPIYYVHDFLTINECDKLIQAGLEGGFHPSPVVGDSPLPDPTIPATLRAKPKISSARTSTTIYLDRADVPTLVSKVTNLTGVGPSQCELPQVAQYLPDQKYDSHYDAFDTTTPNGVAFCQNGGQRICTVLVYLNDVEVGGRTSFPMAFWREDLRGEDNMLNGGQGGGDGRGVSVRPRKGGAVVFFPSHNTYNAMGKELGLVLDPLALHRAEEAVDVKYVSQVWIRAGEYNGVPSRRLSTPI